MIGVDVSVACELWAALPNAEALAVQAIEKARKVAKVKLYKDAEVSLVLTDDAQIKSLNLQWRSQDKPTNVLSFPAAPVAKLATAPLLGDIVVAFETVQKETLDDHKTLADHFTHLIVHGFLHLIGYDHENGSDAEIMEALEIKILADLKIANPYADTELVIR